MTAPEFPLSLEHFADGITNKRLIDSEVQVARIGRPIFPILPRGGPTQERGRDAVNTIEETSACRVDQPEE
jgi:hypothetical protein